MTISRPLKPALTRSAALTAAVLLLLSALVACGDSSPGTADAEAITVSDQWVKTAQSGMTAAFAILHNSADRDIRIVSAHTGAARTTEMHEMVDNGAGGTIMRQKDGGFVIPAHGSMTLTPGGEHFMLMELPKPVTTGQNLAFTIRFADGSTTDFRALARDFDGNQENYVPGGEHDGMGK